jgi:putative membrane protein insertion efficiency factor
MRALNFLAVVAIRVYQQTLSRALRRRGVRCLHYPSCSQYGLLAFRQHGFVRAAVLTWRRCRDCHPYSGRPYIDFP